MISYVADRLRVTNKSTHNSIDIYVKPSSQCETIETQQDQLLKVRAPSRRLTEDRDIKKGGRLRAPTDGAVESKKSTRS
ncbi:MAG: hypothetical protein ACI9OI_002108 [Chitinophagales bacterium]|jgi:hypothetical protein